MKMSRWLLTPELNPVPGEFAAPTAVHSGLTFNRYSRYNIIPQSNPIKLFHY